MIDANRCIGERDILFITLDTLRFDVASRLHATGHTPRLNKLLPTQGWEKRHTPGSFTFAAHMAFFAGFLCQVFLAGRILGLV